METPEYKVLQDSFMEPNHVKAGSIVRTWGPPGPHLQPMNATAIEQMEKWYGEAFDEYDQVTGKLTGEKIYPHEKFRIRSSFAKPEDRHYIEVVSGPKTDQVGSLSLAETLASPRKSTDQRPGPLAQHMEPGVTAALPATPPEPEVAPPEVRASEPAPSVIGGEILPPEPPVEEPIPTEVVFAAQPPSARRNA